MNKHRGEVAITLTIDGEERTLAMRPTFDFIATVEARFGSLVSLTKRFNSNEWSVMEMMAVIEAGLSHDKTVATRGIRDAVLYAGPVEFVAPVATLLLNVLTGGRESEGNAQPAA